MALDVRAVVNGLCRRAPRELAMAGVLATLSLGALGACSKPVQGEARDAGAAPTGQAPHRKPGLWKQSLLQEGSDTINSFTLCLDAEADTKLSWWSQQGFKRKCSKNELKQQPDGSWKFSSICEGMGMRMTNDGSAVGDFNSKYQIKAESTTTGAPNPVMNGTRVVTIDGEWLGECPAGMKPGDIETADGRRMNMLQMMQQR